MPTRKQRRRALKERRHEYETVWVDEEGNELEEPPDDVVATTAKRDGATPRAKAQPQRGGRPVRVPPAPSWQRAAKRSLILGVVIFVAFYLAGAKSGSNRLLSAIEITVIYTVLFMPFQFMIDRFAYTRYQRREAQAGTKRPAAKKR
jgi:hypothetical protein